MFFLGFSTEQYRGSVALRRSHCGRILLNLSKMPPKGRPKLLLSQNERLSRQAELKRQARQRKRSAQKAKSIFHLLFGFI
jgi:hypothetical protein